MGTAKFLVKCNNDGDEKTRMLPDTLNVGDTVHEVCDFEGKQTPHTIDYKF